MQCDGKNKYPSRAVARKYIRKIERRRKRELRAYHCKICHNWHLTSERRNKF